MAQVTIALNGRNYAVACDDGQQERIRELARYIESKISGFVAELGQLGEARLLLLAALTLADELADTRAGLAPAAPVAPVPVAGNGHAPERNDPGLAAGIEALAQRIETVTSRLVIGKR